MSEYSCGTPSRAACPALKARDISLSTVHSGVACTVPRTRDGFRGHCRSPRTYCLSTRSRCQCGTRVGPPYLRRSVSRQKEWWPRSSRARRTVAVDAKRCRRTSQRTATPQENLGKAQRCRCGQVPAGASLASSRDVGQVLDVLSLKNKPNMCYEPLERFIDIMERRQSNGGQQRHYPFRHPKWRYPYLEGPSTRPYTPTRSLLLQIHSHSNLANR